MDLRVRLMQKNGITAMKLAEEFLSMEVGERINTVASYSEKFDKARGTIQSAIKLLQEYGAISIEARGHLGSFITKIDYKKLLEFTSITTFIGVMPLPYSNIYKGLATGLYKCLDNRQIPFSLAYMRGAGTRIEALENGRYDFVVVSKLAALNSMENGMNIEIIVEFGQSTYVTQHVMIFSHPRKRTVEDGMKIGIDRNSIDHKILTMEQCKNKTVEFMDIPYVQILSKVISGEIDAAVINLDEIIDEKIKINYHRLDKQNDDDTIAVIVVNRKSIRIMNLLKKFINKEEVLEYQRKVMENKIIPNY